MTRITNADQVLALLQGHLQRSGRTGRKHKAGATAKSRASQQKPIERLQDIAQSADLPDREIERALLSAILVEEFGAASANDPRFQSMVDDVLRIIREDDRSHTLLERARMQLVGRRD